MSKNIYIIGSGGHSRSISDVLNREENEFEMSIVNVSIENGEIENLQALIDIVPAGSSCLVAVGNNLYRKRIYEAIGQKVNWDNIISGLSYISDLASLGEGIFVGNMVHVGPYSYIGHNTILNTSSVIEHDCKIGNHTHISPGALIAGGCTIGDNVWIGMGAKIIQGVHICDDVTVGAGATVIHDITEPGIYVGTPAEKVR